MINARYWLSRPLTQAQRDWCRRHESDLTLAFFAVVIFLTMLALNACSYTLSDFEGKHSTATYQSATAQRCNYRPSEALVQALLARNELFKDPNTMAAAICSQRQ